MATRPWSFPASAMPGLVTLAFLFFNESDKASLDWIAGVSAMLGAIIFHCSGNLISDYFDFKYGVDTKDNLTNSNLTIVDNIIPAKQILAFGVITMVIGAAIGCWLVLRCGMPILYIGAIGTILTFFYYKLKFSALGDIDILLTFGILVPLGVSYALLGRIYYEILYISLSTGFLVVNILHSNNTRDVINDGNAGIKTLPMLLGSRGSKLYFVVLEIAAYLIVLINILIGRLPYLSLIVLLSAPIAFKNIKTMLTSKENRDIATLDGESAKLVMVFSLLLAISCILSPILFS